MASKSPSIIATNMNNIMSVIKPIPAPIIIRNLPVKRCSLLIAIPPKITVMPPKAAKIKIMTKMVRKKFSYSGNSFVSQSVNNFQNQGNMRQLVNMKSIPEINA